MVFSDKNRQSSQPICNSINNILHRIPTAALPQFTSVTSLYDHFSKYFVYKIETVRSEFPDKVLNIPSVQKPQIKSINNILHRIPTAALPQFTSVTSLYDHFSKYFVYKIETVRSEFPDKVLNIPSVQKPQIKSKMKSF